MFNSKLDVPIGITINTDFKIYTSNTVISCGSTAKLETTYMVPDIPGHNNRGPVAFIVI